MGLPARPEQGEYSYGKGTVCIVRTDPKDYVLHEGGDKDFLYLAARMYEQNAKAGKLEFKITSICKGEITTWLLCLKKA